MSGVRGDYEFNGHECNMLCAPADGVHAVLTYSTHADRLEASHWQEVTSRWRHNMNMPAIEILSVRAAPEAPPLDVAIKSTPLLQDLLRHAPLPASAYRHGYVIFARMVPSEAA